MPTSDHMLLALLLLHLERKARAKDALRVEHTKIKISSDLRPRTI